MDLGFDYVIENSFTNDTINLFKSNLLSCHPDSSKLPLKFIQFIGCEMKDAIFSSIYHMKNFCEQKSLELQIYVLTTNRVLSLLNLKFPNNDVFRLQYLKYNQSKSFVGIEKQPIQKNLLKIIMVWKIMQLLSLRKTCIIILKQLLHNNKF